MVKWTVLLASLKQRHYNEASKELDVIQDYDDLQDALQVIPFKSLNQDLPASLGILEKLYAKFISLTNDKEEGRLIIRHVFKVDMLLKNIIRVLVEDGLLGETIGRYFNKDSVDQITQITWNMDSSILKEVMSRLTRLKAISKHYRTTLPTLLDFPATSEDIKTDLKCCLVKLNPVIEHLERLIKGDTQRDAEKYSNDPSLCRPRDAVEQIRKRCTLNQEVLDVLEPCRENIERGPVLVESLRRLVRDDTKFLECMTELFADISSSCSYAEISVEKLLEHFITSHKAVLSAVGAVSKPSIDSQRSYCETSEKNRSLVSHGLKLHANGSPFYRRFDTRRFSSHDQRERRGPLRTHSCREPRSGELFAAKDSVSDSETERRLREKLALKEKQLEETRSLVKNFKKREEQLLEKLTEQAKCRLFNSEKFENISDDTPRVENLVKQYDDLYSQLRLDALDDLDNIETFDSVERSDELKSQITFAAITVSYYLAQKEIETRRERIFSLLSIDGKSLEDEEYSLLRNEISLQLRRSASKVDLKHVVEEVFSGLCSTMFDFPELKSCDQLRRFIEACVRFSWSICAHVPPLTISNESTIYTSLLHNKSYNSNQECDTVRYHVWPALVESENKTVLYKGVVTT